MKQHIRPHKRYRYQVAGDVRGIVSRHHSMDMAMRSRARDQIACEKQGGYSDTRIYLDGNLLP